MRVGGHRHHYCRASTIVNFVYPPSPPPSSSSSPLSSPRAVCSWCLTATGDGGPGAVGDTKLVVVARDGLFLYLSHLVSIALVQPFEVEVKGEGLDLGRRGRCASRDSRGSTGTSTRHRDDNGGGRRTRYDSLGPRPLALLSQSVQRTLQRRVTCPHGLMVAVVLDSIASG
jgi:hypothetical protein